MIAQQGNNEKKIEKNVHRNFFQTNISRILKKI
jgi:hypothetical protein